MPASTLAPLRRLATLLVALAALGLSGVAAAATETTAERTAALERALERQPNDAVLAWFLAVYRARAGDRDAAFDLLERVLRDGEGFMPSAEMFPSLKNDRRFLVLQRRFDLRAARRDDGRVAFRLHDRVLLPEGIAYDANGRRFYVGSVARSAIFRIGASGALSRFSPPDAGLDAVLGLAIDADVRRLYAVSTNALTAEGRRNPRNSVKAFDLPGGRLLATWSVPDAGQLNDVAVAGPRLLLATDSARGAVYRIDLADDTVTPLVPPGGAPGANGIAVDRTGRVAFVAASLGVVRVDLASGETVPLALPPRENAAAIDGLYFRDRSLIGIQNVTTPGRVVRLVLDPDLRRAERVEILQSYHQHALDLPTTAAIAPDGLYVLARTSLDRLDEQGRVADPAGIQPPLVLRVPLPAAR